VTIVLQLHTVYSDLKCTEHNVT